MAGRQAWPKTSGAVILRSCLTASDAGSRIQLSVIPGMGEMRARATVAAAAIAVILAVFGQASASADAPTGVAIQAHPCNFAGQEVGLWEASGAINDAGTYVRTEGATSPPDRPPFSNGPFRETFVFTGALGTFTVSAEERLTDNGVTGVWQIRPAGTGAYASASGHGDVAFSGGTPNACPPPFNQFTLSLTGVASKVG